VYARNIKTERRFLAGKTENKEYYLSFQRIYIYNIKIDSKNISLEGVGYTHVGSE
jgi:hypothetical protein